MLDNAGIVTLRYMTGGRSSHEAAKPSQAKTSKCVESIAQKKRLEPVPQIERLPFGPLSLPLSSTSRYPGYPDALFVRQGTGLCGAAAARWHSSSRPQRGYASKVRRSHSTAYGFDFSVS